MGDEESEVPAESQPQEESAAEGEENNEVNIPSTTLSFSVEDEVIQEDSPSLEDNEDSQIPINEEEDLMDVTYGPNDRVGTTSSARFNILSTMVGGGSLSLPLAFAKSGNGLLGPIILIIVALCSQYCFGILIDSARRLSPVSATTTRTGKDSYATIAGAAFGDLGYQFCIGLVTFMCFFGTIGYAVLLRDMLVPFTNMIFPKGPLVPVHNDTNGTNHTLWWVDQQSLVEIISSTYLLDDATNSTGPASTSPTFRDNSTMLLVVLLITPLCTLQTLTSLKRFGAASMFSVLILGSCILFRSIECNLGLLSPGEGFGHYKFWNSFQLWPDSLKDVLDAFPLFVSCFVCHYNIPTVHNELRQPSSARAQWWLTSTVWLATGFYLVMGMAGSAYRHCTPTGTVSGNILLDFPQDDPLLLVGRSCLAITLTLAFPMLTIPARDIVIDIIQKRKTDESTNEPREVQTDVESMQEPLLENDHLPENEESTAPAGTSSPSADSTTKGASFCMRLGVAVLVFWSAAAVASCVKSIDIVWDLLGSSLSMLMSYLIPCGSYIYLAKHDPTRTTSWLSLAVAWLLLIVASPLMVVSSANAVYNTFFQDPE